MKFRVWVEVFTVDRVTEDVIEVPEEKWDAMSPAERDAYMAGCFDGMRDNVANGGYEEIEEG